MPDNKESYVKKLLIERTYPDELKSYFSTHMVVQHQDETFIVSYFELWPPAIIADTIEEKKKSLDAIEKVQAKCIARIVIPAHKMKDFIQAMQNNFDAYLKGKGEEKQKC